MICKPIANLKELHLESSKRCVLYVPYIQSSGSQPETASMSGMYMGTVAHRRLYQDQGAVQWFERTYKARCAREGSLIQYRYRHRCIPVLHAVPLGRSLAPEDKLQRGCRHDKTVRNLAKASGLFRALASHLQQEDTVCRNVSESSKQLKLTLV